MSHVRINLTGYLLVCEVGGGWVLGLRMAIHKYVSCWGVGGRGTKNVSLDVTCKN